jgi:aminoglycoside phosphotransferase (APT) family kinase protein
MLAKLTMHADLIILPLQEQPPTFLHGDYWPGNIAILSDGSQIVYDWQLAGVGPGILDLLVFTNKSMWHFDALPVDPQEIIAWYREGMLKLNGVSWDESEWAMLWDHALMWRFLQEWVDLLAASPGSLLETRAEQLSSVWFDPVAAAVSRRLETE